MNNLMPDLKPDEYKRLKSSIEEHGVLYPALLDASTKEVVDGHHRLRACSELGVECPTIERAFADEAEREIIAIETNLARRQMGPVAWGEWFTALLERKGVRTGQGSRNDHTSATLAEVAGQQGVPQRTARSRMELADVLQDFPTLKGWVDGPAKFPQEGAKTIVREHPDLARDIEGGEISQEKAKEEYQRRTPDRPRAQPVHPTVEDTFEEAARRGETEELARSKMSEDHRAGFRTRGLFMDFTGRDKIEMVQAHDTQEKVDRELDFMYRVREAVNDYIDALEAKKVTDTSRGNLRVVGDE